MIGLDLDLVRRISVDGKRVDGRAADELRKITIETNIVNSAEGSARVTIGDTIVIAGVKMGVGTPFPDTPNEGVLMVSGEFVPLADADFESGPPKEEPVELSRVVDRAIRESKAIDVKNLVITAGEKVWMAYVDIDIIDNGGNLIDAAGIAAVAALSTVKFPELDKENNIVYGKKTDKKLPLDGTPLSTTFVKIGNSIFLDPTKEEYLASDARMTIGTIDKEELKLCSMQKNGEGGFTVDEIHNMIEIAEKKSEEIRKMVKKSI
jgi:exosome complex component RRP42